MPTPEQRLTRLPSRWQGLLDRWATDGSIAAAASDALQLQLSRRRASVEHLASLLQPDGASLPAVALLSGQQMGGARGAYAASNGTIFLNSTWLARASSRQVLSVLTEEFGHHLDSQLNRRDSRGDEGELFSALLLRRNLTPLQRRRILQDSDSGSLLINGQRVAVELALSTKATITSVIAAAGVIANGGFTNDTTPTIKGKLPQRLGRGETLRVFNGNALLGTAKVNTRSWSFTPTLAPTAGSTFNIRTRVRNSAGKLGVASATRTFTLDTQGPALTISDNNGGIATGPVTFSFAFSEAVSGFSADDIKVTGGTKGPFSGSGANYTLLVTPTPNSTGTITVDVGAGVAADAAGNGNAAATQASQVFDTQAPAAPSIAPLPSSISNQSTVTLAITAEPGSVVAVLSNGSPLGIASESSSTPGSFSFSSTALADGLYAFTATASDSTGNTSAPSGTVNLTIDTTAPDAPELSSNTLSNDPTPLISGTAEANAALTLSIAGATYATTASSNGLWSVDTGTATPSAGSLALNLNGTNPLSLTATDAAGNSSATTTSNLVLDTTRPTLSISDNASGIASGPVTFSFVFSEPVTGFTANVITVTGGTKGAFDGSGSSYSLIVTPNPGPAGSIHVEVDAGVATDLAGNSNTAAGPISQEFASTYTLEELAPVIAMGSSIPVDSLEARYLHSDGGIIYVAFAADLDLTLQDWWLDVLATADALIEPDFALVSPDNPLRQVTISQVADLTGASGQYSYRYFIDGSGNESRADPSDYTLELDNDAFGFNILFGDTPEAGWKFVAFHELGHALGLEHTFDADDGDQDRSLNINDSVMSYTYVIDNDGHPGFTPLDQAALISIHGAESGAQAIADASSTPLGELGPFNLTETWKSPTLTMAFESGPSISEPAAGTQRTTRLLLTRSDGVIDHEARVNLNWSFGPDLYWNYPTAANTDLYDVLISRDSTSGTISQVVFNAGELTASLEIIINGDTDNEGTEWLEVAAISARNPDYFFSIPSEILRLSITPPTTLALAEPTSALAIPSTDPLTGASLTPSGNAEVDPQSTAGDPIIAGVETQASDQQGISPSLASLEPEQPVLSSLDPLVAPLWSSSDPLWGAEHQSMDALI